MNARAEGVAAAAGARAVATTSARLAAAIRDEVPGVAVRIVADGVELSARGLARRALEEPVLRWPAALVRGGGR